MMNRDQTTSRTATAGGLLRLLVVLIVISQTGQVLSDTVVLNVKGRNPADKRRSVAIKSALPSGLRTNNIVSLDGLTPGYDVMSGLYYVGGTVEMAPGETRTYSVVLEDIWTIPSRDIDQLQTHAKLLAAQLKGTAHEARAMALDKVVTGQLLGVTGRQTQNKAEAVDAERHIAVFHELVSELSVVRNSLFELENMVLSTGQDPGELVGEATGQPKKAKRMTGKQEPQQATFTIMVTNPSPTEAHNATIMRYLPRELTAADVIDSAGLDVGTNPESGLCYVRKATVPLGPGTSAVYNVVIKDKWNVNEPRIAQLKGEASNMFVKVRSWGRYKSVEQQLLATMGELDRLANTAAPQAMGDAYVAHFREQAALLDRVERALDRLAQAPYRTSVIGPNTPPPTRKTTWGIIFTIIGFLAIVTLIVVFSSLRRRPAP